jgi:methionyl-tRNA formyltransferase
MRTVFLGSPPFAAPAFAALLARDEPPIALVTASARRAGRGRKDLANPLREMAEAQGLTVFQPENVRDPKFMDSFAALEADLGIVVSYGQILDWKVLVAPRFGCINVHGSLLPRWRGASPVQAALLAGDEETGVCIQQMVEALDAGPVLAERRLILSPDERADELFEKLSLQSAELLVEFLNQVGDGPLPDGAAQDPRLVTSCKKIKAADSQLDWNWDSQTIDRHVRAMAGWPSAKTSLPDGTNMKVHRGEPSSLKASGEPGEVASLEGGLFICCGQGTFRVDSLQREGKAVMSAQEFLRGADLKIGSQFG